MGIVCHFHTSFVERYLYALAEVEIGGFGLWVGATNYYKPNKKWYQFAHAYFLLWEPSKPVSVNTTKTKHWGVILH